MTIREIEVKKVVTSSAVIDWLTEQFDDKWIKIACRSFSGEWKKKQFDELETPIWSKEKKTIVLILELNKWFHQSGSTKRAAPHVLLQWNGKNINTWIWARYLDFKKVKSEQNKRLPWWWMAPAHSLTRRKKPTHMWKMFNAIVWSLCDELIQSWLDYK